MTLRSATLETSGQAVIQASKLELPIMRYELTNDEWATIKPRLPNKPRGIPRVNDRRVLNDICWVLRSGAPWRDLPHEFGPYTTCYNRFVRWRRAGVWSRIMDAVTAAHDAAVQMIDTSIVRVHQHWSGRLATGPWTVSCCEQCKPAACRSGSRSQQANRTTIGLPPSSCPA
jgi:transposase